MPCCGDRLRAANVEQLGGRAWNVEGSRMLVNVSRAISRPPIRPGCRGVPRARSTMPGTRPGRRAVLDGDIALGLQDIGAVRFGEFTLKSGSGLPLYRPAAPGERPVLMARVAGAMSGSSGPAVRQDRGASPTEASPSGRRSPGLRQTADLSAQGGEGLRDEEADQGNARGRGNGGRAG